MVSGQDVWVGLVHVKFRPGSKLFRRGDEGAYVYAFAWTGSSAGFRAKVRSIVSREHLDLVGIKRIAPFIRFCQKYQRLKKKLVRLAQAVKKRRDARLDTVFFCYPRKSRTRNTKRSKS